MTDGNARSEELQRQLDAARDKMRALEAQVAHERRASEELEEDRHFRAAVIEKAAEGVCVCHDIPDYPFVRFTVWNPRMIEITGYSMDEINELGWYQTMYPDPEVQDRAGARMDRMREGDDLSFERWEITRADGEKRPVAISTSVLTARDGTVHVLGLMHDFSERELLETERLLARMDSLTGVKNRRGFLEHASIVFELATRQNQSVALGYLDVDDLKLINDTLGHAAGDRLLAAVGEVLRDALRSSDVFGRLGGDEFAVVLFAAGIDELTAGFRRLHDRLLETARGGGWSSGVSLGVVSYRGVIPTLEVALSHADATMYRAKQSGKGALLFEEGSASDSDASREVADHETA